MNIPLDAEYLLCKALSGYKELIELPENQFLEEELGYPLEQIEAKLDSIHINFRGGEFEYHLTVNLKLLETNSDKKVGRYFMVFEENLEVIDDGLVC